MNNKPLVSVLIPIYRTERYIRRCIGSVLKQDYRPLEVVLVDDCGGDNSMDIACEMLQDAENIVLKPIYHEFNRGISKSRRDLLFEAGGDFIMFLDSDDYWDNPGNVSDLIHQFELHPDVDCIVTDYIADYPKKKIYTSVDCPESPVEAAKAILRGQMPGFLWNKVYKRSTFLAYAGGFETNLSVWEDVSALVLFFARGAKLFYYEYAFVHYEQGNGHSIVHNMSLSAFNDLISAINYCAEKVSSFGDYEEDILIAYLNAKAFALMNVSYRDYARVLKIHPEVDKYNGLRKVPLYSKIIYCLQRHKATGWLGFLSVKLMNIWKYILRQ